MFKYFKSRKKLLSDMAELEIMIIEDERKRSEQKIIELMEKHNQEKVNLINKHENKLIEIAKKAADERESELQNIIDDLKNDKRNLQREINDIKDGYRSQKHNFEKVENVTGKLLTNITIIRDMATQMCQRVSDVSEDLFYLGKSIDKKDNKLIEQGKI